MNINVYNFSYAKVTLKWTTPSTYFKFSIAMICMHACMPYKWIVWFLLLDGFYFCRQKLPTFLFTLFPNLFFKSSCQSCKKEKKKKTLTYTIQSFFFKIKSFQHRQILALAQIVSLDEALFFGYLIL